MISAARLEQFADELPGLTSVSDVSESLHVLAHPLNVYAVWRAPIYTDQHYRYIEGKHVFFHRSVSPAFRLEFWPLQRANGKSPMMLLVFQRKKLMTWSEGMHELALIGQDSWHFDLTRKHGMMDGVYSPSAPWMIGYWSPHVLRGRHKLDTKTRQFLFMAGGFAAGRLEELIEPEKINGKAPVLTARQEEVLRLYGEGHTKVEIASKLEVSIDTVSDVMNAARKKLGARSGHHAAMIALRLHLIACRALIIPTVVGLLC
jgi:DNA-binding CsgD family transcriptional regulator